MRCASQNGWQGASGRGPTAASPFTLTSSRQADQTARCIRSLASLGTLHSRHLDALSLTSIIFTCKAPRLPLDDRQVRTYTAGVARCFSLLSMQALALPFAALSTSTACLTLRRPRPRYLGDFLAINPYLLMLCDQKTYCQAMPSWAPAKVIARCRGYCTYNTMEGTQGRLFVRTASLVPDKLIALAKVIQPRPRPLCTSRALASRAPPPLLWSQVLVRRVWVKSSPVVDATSTEQPDNRCNPRALRWRLDGHINSTRRKYRKADDGPGVRQCADCREAYSKRKGQHSRRAEVEIFHGPYQTCDLQYTRRSRGV